MAPRRLESRKSKCLQPHLDVGFLQISKSARWYVNRSIYLPSPTWPYPMTCLTAPSRINPLDLRCSRVISTHSLKVDNGTEMSYLYAFPSFETASVTPSRRAHRDENCAGDCARTPVLIKGLSASSNVSSKVVSFYSRMLAGVRQGRKLFHLFVMFPSTTTSLNKNETLGSFDILVTKRSSLSMFNSQVIGGAVYKFKRGKNF